MDSVHGYVPSESKTHTQTHSTSQQRDDYPFVLGQHKAMFLKLIIFRNVVCASHLDETVLQCAKPFFYYFILVKDVEKNSLPLFQVFDVSKYPTLLSR